MEWDLAAQRIEDMQRFLLKETEASVERRQALWRSNFSSRQAYETSVAPNRGRFRKIIGLIDNRVTTGTGDRRL